MKFKKLILTIFPRNHAVIYCLLLSFLGFTNQFCLVGREYNLVTNALQLRCFHPFFMEIQRNSITPRSNICSSPPGWSLISALLVKILSKIFSSILKIHSNALGNPKRLVYLAIVEHVKSR